ncbi:MAG TPA: SDR family NAD(P)-dependent oxidoreductase [Acidimicrobiales bacterium]|nr:SDR family NAD(P)-dependent oxidoreductase [Acidimicrobiales bacterium]
MGDFEGKVVLITGGARGQGRSHAVALAREGASVALLDIANGELTHPPARVASAQDLAETVSLVEAAGGRALGIPCDVRDEGQVVNAVDQAVDHFGGLDFVIANAGILGLYQQSWTIPTEDWRASLETNLTGQWLTLKHTIPHLIARGPGCAIIMVSSGAGIDAFPYGSDYCAAKHGVIGLGLCLANELGPYGIRVNMLVPGAHDTPMIGAASEVGGPDRESMLAQLKGLDLLGAGAIKPEEGTTPAVLWLLSEKAKWIHGSIQVIDAGLNAKVALEGAGGPS